MPASTASDIPDGDLAERAREGDEQAFTMLVQRYERAVFALCARHLGTADAADATQETFVRAFTRLERFDRGRQLLPWLLTIARHLCIDHRRSRRHEAQASAAAEVAGASPEHHLAARAELGQLERAFAALPDGPREALALFHFHDLSYKQIAEQLEIPMGTVMTWIHRGRDALRRAFADGSVPATAARARRSGE